MGFLDVCVVAGVAGFLAWALKLGIELAPSARTQRFRSVGDRPGTSSLVWTSAGAVLTALLVVVAWRFRAEPTSTQALVRQAERIELVERMRSMIAEACDAESAAVMSADAGRAREAVDRSR